MTEFTRKEMLDNLEFELKKNYPDLNYSLSKEDGFSMISLWGTGINPKVFDIVSQQIANATKREFYFSNATTDTIQGFLNAKFHYLDEEDNIPERHDESIKSYGTEFIPQSLSNKIKIK